jgi:hypothetical protein
MKQIVEDEGIILLNEGNEYYIQYDAGELMIKIKRLEITKEEAENIISNPQIMYDIIIEYQDKGIYGDIVNI